MLLIKKEEIETWLNKYEITNYELIKDKNYGYVVNVNRNVSLFNYDLENIKVKFNKIKGNFDCSDNRLISLEGCPKEIKHDFFCNNNILKSLKGGPAIVYGCFDCGNNKLTSLEGNLKK